MRNIFYFITCLAFLLNCSPRPNEQSDVYLNNASNQDVHIKLTSSTDSSSESIFIKPNEDYFLKTISRSSAAISSPLEKTLDVKQIDTCFVIFNDTVALVFTYDENSERNILFMNSYNISVGSSTRNFRNYICRYTITEQDFLDAEPL